MVPLNIFVEKPASKQKNGVGKQIDVFLMVNLSLSSLWFCFLFLFVSTNGFFVITFFSAVQIMPGPAKNGSVPARRRKRKENETRSAENENPAEAFQTGTQDVNCSSGNGEINSSNEAVNGRNASVSGHSESINSSSNDDTDNGSQLTGPSFGTDNAAVRLTSSNSVCTATSAEQSYREHQADVGAHVCMKNLKELAKRRGTNEVFRLFKFPPKERDTNQMKVFKVAVLKSMGMISANNVTKDKFDKASEKLKELLPSVKVGMRNKRATVIEACDLEIQRTYAGFHVDCLVCAYSIF